MRAIPKAGKGFAAVTPNPKLKLLDQVRECEIAALLDSQEQSYRDWLRRYIKLHRMRLREELIPGGGKIRNVPESVSEDWITRYLPERVVARDPRDVL